jgi:hypothetical protein
LPGSEEKERKERSLTIPAEGENDAVPGRLDGPEDSELDCRSVRI